MIKLTRGVLKRGFQIFHFQIGHLFKDLICGKTGSEKIQHIDNTYAHAANARSSSTLLCINGNSIH